MQTTLEGHGIILRPLQYSDAAALLHAAADGDLWNLTVTIVLSVTSIDSYLKKALDGREAGTVMPFVIVLQDSGEVIGSTRFWKIDLCGSALLMMSGRRFVKDWSRNWRRSTYARPTVCQPTGTKLCGGQTNVR